MKSLVIREGTWDWCYYLFFVVLIGTSIFFIVHACRSLASLRKSKEAMAASAKGYRQQLTVNIYFLARNILPLIMVFLSFFLIWLTYKDTFNGFTRIQISGGTFKLFYMWPVPSREGATPNIEQVYTAKWGKDTEVINIVTATGTFKSVSNYSEQIEADCHELKDDLANDGR